MPYNVYRDDKFHQPIWIKKVLPKNISIGAFGFSFRYDPEGPLTLLEVDGFLTAVADQRRTGVKPPSRFQRKPLSDDEIAIFKKEEERRWVGKTDGLDEVYNIYLLHLKPNWDGYDCGEYFSCLLKPELDSEVPFSYTDFLSVKVFAIPYLDKDGRFQENYGDLLKLLRVREIYLTFQ